MNLVTLRVYTTETEAEIFRIFLENNGIAGFIFNANSAALYPMFNNTIVGVQLKVREDDFENAEKLLHEFYQNDPDKMENNDEKN